MTTVTPKKRLHDEERQKLRAQFIRNQQLIAFEIFVLKIQLADTEAMIEHLRE